MITKINDFIEDLKEFNLNTQHPSEIEQLVVTIINDLETLSEEIESQDSP